MSASRYREARTLVRRLCRLPGEDHALNKQKVARLRRHFERFNVDTSELCQWLMGLRKQYVKSLADPSDADPASFGVLGDFLLEPSLGGVKPDEKIGDRWRLHVFDDVAGFRSVSKLDDQPLPERLRNAMDAAAAARPRQGSNNSSAYKLFERLSALEAQHRLVLLKSAAEWIVARYLRGVENWEWGHKAWKDDKHEREQNHPKLTEIRDRYTNVFKQLKDPERDDKPGLRKKNPRICPYERLKQNIDNCIYAGQKGHGPLCWKYVEFVKAHKAKDNRFNDGAFFDAASDLAALCREHNVTNLANALNSQHILDQLFAKDQQRKQEKSKNKKRHGPQKKVDPQRQKADFLRIFKANWNAYLAAINLTGQTAVEKGCLPHCRKIGGKVFEKSGCIWNPHTNYCLEYKRALTNPDNGFDDDTLALEDTYREWRKDFLAGPRKPQFRYPSARDLPMPKVFGEGFHEIDFDNSILRLRLDGMPPDKDKWLEFGFTPWPRKYSPSRVEIAQPGRVTSVHVNFPSPAHCRIGFRFDVEHKHSRFTVTQDELDDLRSKTYTRQAEDQQFLDAARQRLFNTFDGDHKRDLRILAIDMGMGGAHAALYQGKNYQQDIAIPIIKINKSYTELPSQLEKKPEDRRMRGPLEMAIDPDDSKKIIDTRGLRKEHVGRHLNTIAEGAAKIAQKRQQDADEPMQNLRDSDFRGLKRHIRWMVRDWARLNAKQIINIAEQHDCHVIVFESLRGSRRPDYDKLGSEAERQKAERIIYAYGQVRRKVTEKAVERGLRTVTAPYHKSSKVCHACGHEQLDGQRLRFHKGNRKFVCECGDETAKKEKVAPKCRCTAEVNSDANAARVLARVFWREITLPTPSPSKRWVRA